MLYETFTNPNNAQVLLVIDVAESSASYELCHQGAHAEV